jgi:hypothetical protein
MVHYQNFIGVLIVWCGLWTACLCDGGVLLFETAEEGVAGSIPRSPP